MSKVVSSALEAATGSDRARARVRVTVVTPAQVALAMFESDTGSGDSDVMVEIAESHQAEHEPAASGSRISDKNRGNGVGLGSWRGAVSGLPWRLSGNLSDVSSSTPGAHRSRSTGSTHHLQQQGIMSLPPASPSASSANNRVMLGVPVTVFVSAQDGVDSVRCGRDSDLASMRSKSESPKSEVVTPCRTLTQALANAHRSVRVGSSSGSRYSRGVDRGRHVDSDGSGLTGTLRDDRSPPSPPAGIVRQILLRLAAGYYDTTNCGIFTNASLSIIGNGADVTIIDCQHQQRLLHTTGPALVLSSLTVMNGNHTADMGPIKGQGGGNHHTWSHSAGGVLGGGAVCVDWSQQLEVGNSSSSSLSVLVQDVVFRHNTLRVTGTVNGASRFTGNKGITSQAVGGGAVSIVGAGPGVPGVSIAIEGCVFDGNDMSVSSTSDLSPDASVMADWGGGGLLVAYSESGDAGGIVFISVTNTTFTNNVSPASKFRVILKVT